MTAYFQAENLYPSRYGEEQISKKLIRAANFMKPDSINKVAYQ